MTTTIVMPDRATNPNSDDAIRSGIEGRIDDFISSLPNQTLLSADEKRGIIARYSAVLEGNFIYWMTATLIAVKTEEARPILLDNLHEEIRDSHPAMLRRFYSAANAFPSEKDARDVTQELTDMRLFMGQLNGIQSLAAMAYFEGTIQKFMPYLAALAASRGSNEMEYTDVHGVCDIAHTEGLFQALFLEKEAHPLPQGSELFEGVDLLDTLMRRIVFLNSQRAQ
jgi:hypothetical protein